MAILCIDDDPQFCDAIAGVLGDAGYRAVAARTAGEGLQHARIVELAIVDLHLRGLSGEELVRAIREVRPDVPVILTSGVPPEDGKLIARRCGAQHFLPKPFDLDELLRVVDTLLGDARAAEAAGPPKLRA
jgi:DNA-binding response OmpR family regulator